MPNCGVEGRYNVESGMGGREEKIAIEQPKVAGDPCRKWDQLDGLCLVERERLKFLASSICVNFHRSLTRPQMACSPIKSVKPPAARTRNPPTMTKFLTITVALLLSAAPAAAWFAERPRLTPTSLRATPDELASAQSHLEDDSPCWQDMMDGDCNMSNIFASSFVAKDWVKSLPCAAGVEVSSANERKILFG